MNWINNFLNKFTMYFLVLNLLRALILLATILAFFNVLPYVWWHIPATMMFFILACWGINELLGRVFGVSPNFESQFITAEILTLIVGPMNPLDSWVFLLVVSAVAMASKYLIAMRKRHLFNPAAIGLVAAALIVNQSASWWIGSMYMLPLVLVGGFLINYKTRYLHLVWSFLITYAILFVGISVYNAADLGLAMTSLKNVLLNSGLIFFATIMLTEPLTAPATRKNRVGYGIAIAVVLIVIQQQFVEIYYNLELALVIGNLLAFAISPNPKINLRLKTKDWYARGSLELVFEPEYQLNFKPGQFMQFIVPHAKADSRGSRRFFSIASSPTEKHVMLATKIPEKPSSFKNHLKDMQKDQLILASSLDGDFTLPNDESKGLVFIAGGIGITPFRSMIKYLVDTGAKRPITLFYSNKDYDEIGFTELLDEAEQKIGLKTVYILTDKLPPNWSGKKGFITPDMIRQEVGDHQSKLYYLSGPDPMVRAYQKMLRGMGISRFQVKTDYFPGYEQ